MERRLRIYEKKGIIGLILICICMTAFYAGSKIYQEKRVSKILLDDSNYFVDMNIDEKNNNGTVTLSIDSGKMIVFTYMDNELNAYDYINMDLCAECPSNCIYSKIIGGKDSRQNNQYKHAKQLKKELNQWFKDIDITEKELTVFMKNQIKNG